MLEGEDMKERVKIWKPSPEEIEEIKQYPTWQKGQSEFEWFYDEDETFYLLEGEVEVEFPDGSKVNFKKGDMVKFKAGTECKWKIKEKVLKHYKIG
jgi:uncharacterized cupin superfamily protein